MDIITAGMIIIFIGIIIVIIGALSGVGKGESKFAIGGIIGFIPFGFSNDKKLFWTMLIVMAILFIFWIFIKLRFFR